MSSVAMAIVTLSRTGFIGLSKETLYFLLFVFVLAIPRIFKIFLGLDNDDNQK